MRDADVPTGEQLVSRLWERRLLVVVRADDAAVAVTVGGVLLDAGIAVLEVSLTTPGALTAVSALRATAPPGALVGAGTVLTEADARDATDAGAQFLVTPAVTPAVEAAEVPVVCGVLTPTEVVAALRAGAAAVKLFPASFGGAAYLAALRQPFPDVAFVPVGGVGMAEARGLLEVGATAVGIGSPLIGDAVRGGSSQALVQRARALLAAVAEVPR